MMMAFISLFDIELAQVFESHIMEDGDSHI